MPQKHEIYYLGTVIQPVFITEKDGIEHPFEGVSPEDEGLIEDIDDGEYDEHASHDEIVLINDVLHHHFGPVILRDYESGLYKGILEINSRLSKAQMETLKGISIYTDDYPIRYGPSFLKFEIVCYQEECDCDLCSPDPDDG